MDVPLLGWRNSRREVEGSLEEDRGREERWSLLGDLRRRGLRGMEIGRLSCLLDVERWRWERDRRKERWLDGGCSPGGEKWLMLWGKVGTGGCGGA